MLACNSESLTFLRKSKDSSAQVEKEPCKFDNKWLRARRSNHGAPAKPLALSQDEILTNSGGWTVKSTEGGQKVSIEKLSLPTDLKLNSVESAKLMTIKQNLKVLLMVTTKKKIILVNLQPGHENYGLQTLLAEELHDISCLEMSSNGQWLAIGLDTQIWILKLEWSIKSCKVCQIDHFATFEGHREPISGLLFTDSGRLISVSHDRSFNVWSVDNLECLFESPLLGHYSLTSSYLYQGQKSSQILIIGNCDGKLYFFEILQEEDGNLSSAIKVDELKLNASFLNSTKQQDLQFLQDDTTSSSGVQTIRPKGKGAKIQVPAATATSIQPTSLQTSENEASHQGCEILSFMDLGKTKNSSLFEPQCLLVGTTIGLFLINLNTREVMYALAFDHLYNEILEADILRAMVSTLMLSQSANGDINVLTQCMTDEKTAFFQVKFQSTMDQQAVATQDQDAVAIVAQDSPKGFLKNIQKNVEEMNGKVDVKSKTLPSLSKRIKAMASARKIQSSGYAKVHDQPKFFQPRINKKKPNNNKTQLHRAWESNDEGFISPTSSLEDLSSDNNESKPRGKWKCPVKQGANCSKMLEKYSQLANNEVGPSKMTACVKLWQTDGVSTRLFFAPNGSAMAASGAHNSVQVMSSHVLLKLENKDDFTRCDTVEKGSRLMGHIAPVNCVDFASGNSDYLVTSGRDRAVKIWHWRSKTVKLNIDLRKQGRGTGLGKGSVFGSVYGGITAASNNSQLLQKKHKKSGKYDDSVKPFPDSVTQCQFYYMDQFLLSASSNQLFVHQIGLPSQQNSIGQQQSCFETSAKYSDEFWFKYVHQVKLENCKNITAICAPNQFYSHVVLLACSDKSLKFFDTNAQKIIQDVPHCHAKPVCKMVMGKSSSNFGGGILSSCGHNVFLTSAVSDGAKLWDVRSQKCVQKFSWPGSNFGRMQLGVDICSNFQYFAGGSDDGTVYLYDLRKPCSAYMTRLMGGSSKAIPNHCNMSNGYNRSPIVDVAFHSMKSNTLIAATLGGELIKFE